MSFAQGLVGDRAPLTIMANYDGETDCTDKRFLALRPELGTDLGFIATVGCGYLPILMVGVANCSLYKVVRYYPGSNRLKSET